MGYYGQTEESNTHFHAGLCQTLLVLSGKLVFDIPGQGVFNCEDCEILVIPPNVFHSCTTHGKAEAIQILHSPMSLHRYGSLATLFGEKDSSVRHVRIGKQQFRKHCSGLKREIQRPSETGSVLLLARLLELFVCATRSIHGEVRRENHAAQAVRKAILGIENSLSAKHTLASLAKESCLSQSRFSHLFREYTGKSPVQYINELRIERAQNLLAASGMSVSEIAAELGFQSVHYFSRLFKKIKRFPPTAFAGKIEYNSDKSP